MKNYIYKQTSEQEKNLWEESIFVFDSSALLNLYLLPNKTREKIYKEIFEKLSEKLWIPAHVKFEYLKNREKKIKEPISRKYEPLQTDFENLDKVITKNIKNKIIDIKDKIKNENEHPHFDKSEIESFENTFDELINKFKDFKDKFIIQIEDVKKEIIDVHNNDDILDAINKYFDIGNGFTFNEVLEITKEGKHRYEYKIPPGYGDSLGKNIKKGTQIFGDLIIWKEILEYSKQEKKPIIFITNDITKDEDWCYPDDKKRDIVAPREELIKEIYDYSNVEFWMYSQSQFLTKANEYLSSTIDPKIIRNLSNYYDDIAYVLFECTNCNEFNPCNVNYSDLKQYRETYEHASLYKNTTCKKCKQNKKIIFYYYKDTKKTSVEVKGGKTIDYITQSDIIPNNFCRMCGDDLFHSSDEICSDCEFELTSE